MGRRRLHPKLPEKEIEAPSPHPLFLFVPPEGNLAAQRHFTIRRSQKVRYDVFGTPTMRDECQHPPI